MYVYLNALDQEQRLENTPGSLYLVLGAVFDFLYIRVCDTWCMINDCTRTNDSFHQYVIPPATRCIIKAYDMVGSIYS